MRLQLILCSAALALLLAPSLSAQRTPRSQLRGSNYSASAIQAYSGVRASSHKGPVYASHGRRSRRGYRGAQSVWISGCNEWSSERYWVAERYENVWVEPVYGWSLGTCGLRVRICTRAGYWNQVCRPGYYATRRIQRWVPGHWKLR